MKRLLLMFAVALFVTSLASVVTLAAEEAHDAEVKLIVPAALAVEARKSVEPADVAPEGEVVCFYDTADLRLQAAGVILRARQKEGKKGESTVKLTYPDAAAAAADSSTSVKVEEDWVDLKAPRLSRSIDGEEKLKDDGAKKLAQGTLEASEAFDKGQRKLVENRVPGLNWDEVRCFGPISARIWKKVPLAGFADAKMTVEDWLLLKADGVTKDEVLEVSVKGKALSAEQLKTFVETFFQAAAKQNLGSPDAQSKTKRALKFFAPGK